MAGNSENGRRPTRSWGRWLAGGVIVALLVYAFPLLHVVRLATDGGVGRRRPTAEAPSHTTEPFNARAAADRVWRQTLVPAAAHAPELAPFAAELRADPIHALKQHGHEVGIGGTGYFFVRGRGRVTSRTADAVRIELDGAPGVAVDLVSGPIFGNTVRDGTGLLNVNEFSGLEEYNALSAELNHLSETRVEPELRQKAAVGATIDFAGCAEAPESAPAANASLLTIVPIVVAGVGDAGPHASSAAPASGR